MSTGDSDAERRRPGEWRALLELARPHRGTLAVALLLGLIGGAAGLAQPLGARAVIEALADDASLAGPLIVLGVLVVVSATVDSAHYWLLERTSERVVRGARRSLVHRLLRLQLHAVDRLAPGDLTARATSDTTLLGQVASGAAVGLVNGSITLLAALVLMGVVDIVLLLVTVAVLAVVAAAVLVLLPRISRAIQR